MKSINIFSCKQQQQLPVWSHLPGVWEDPNVDSLTLVSITTHKEAESKDPQKFWENHFMIENFW